MNAPTAPARPRIVSGIQPSGRLHLGNYFGAIREHVRLQDEAECFYFIADYHALTSLRDADRLREYVRDVALTYLSVGLDPDKALLYRQSDVPEVCELTWLLSTVTGMGLLERAHAYKEKVARGITPVVGLFTYPLLMAADILGPRADAVPVGQDQDQHIEIARDVAQLFNHAFCAPDDPVFRLPEPRISLAARVPGTTFEKGAALQVVTEIEPRLRSGGPADVDAFVAAFRDLVREVLAGMADDVPPTTEELERRIAEHHDARIPDVVVRSRTLRVAAETPSLTPHVTARGETLGVEFWVDLDRVLFLTRDGRRQAAKMSKSQGNTIEIFAAGKALEKKVKGIETRLVALEDPLDATEDIVMQLYRLLATPEEVAEMEARYAEGGFGFGRAKQALLAKIDAHFAPFRERRSALERDPAFVEDVLRTGAERARAVIRATLDRARAACGIGG